MYTYTYIHMCMCICVFVLLLNYIITPCHIIARLALAPGGVKPQERGPDRGGARKQCGLGGMENRNTCDSCYVLFI